MRFEHDVDFRQSARRNDLSQGQRLSQFSTVDLDLDEDVNVEVVDDDERLRVHCPYSYFTEIYRRWANDNLKCYELHDEV